MFSYPDFVQTMKMCQKIILEDHSYINIQLSPKSERHKIQNNANLRRIQDQDLKQYLLSLVSSLPRGNLEFAYTSYKDPLKNNFTFSLDFSKKHKKNFYSLTAIQTHDKINLVFMVGSKKDTDFPHTNHDIFHMLAHYPRDFTNALQEESLLPTFAGLLRSDGDYPFTTLIKSLLSKSDIDWEKPSRSYYPCLRFYLPPILP